MSPGAAPCPLSGPPAPRAAPPSASALRRAVAWRRVARAVGALAALLIGLAVCGDALVAQDVQFRHLGMADGLPSMHVSAIHRDRHGFLWIGTGRGLSRYDGYQFHTYPSGRAAGALPRGVVLQVYEDRAGTVWVLTPDALCRYDAARDAFVPYLTDSAGPQALIRVAEDGRGTFWVGTSAGLYQFDRRTGAAVAYALRTRPRADGGAPPGPTVDAAVDVWTLYPDRRGRLWVGARDGLYRLTPDGAAYAERRYAPRPGDPGSLADAWIRAVTEDPAGNIWVGTGQGGLARLARPPADPRAPEPPHDVVERFRHDPADSASLSKDHVARLLAEPGGGGLWVGTQNGGLDYLDFRTRRFAHHRYDPDRPSGIGSNSIWALHQGDDGVLWVGTWSGGLDVSLPNRGAIRHYAAVAGNAQSLSYNAAAGFGEDRAGRVWVATDGGGLNRLDPATGGVTRFRPGESAMRAEAVLAVAEGRDGGLWLAAFGYGLARFDPPGAEGGGRGRFRAYGVGAGAPSDYLYEVRPSRAGRLWVGADNGKVAEFDPARGAFLRTYDLTPPGLAPSPARLVRELADGTLAVGLMAGGVALLDPATGARAHLLAAAGRADARLAHNTVNALSEGADGTLWVGTEGGLDALDRRTGRVAHHGAAAGLPSGPVKGIVPDDVGRLWLSTERGLVRYAPGAPPAARVRRYTRADGVRTGEFLARSAFRARDGTLYFGGNDGVTAVRPSRVADAPPVPAVALTGLRLFNQPVGVGAPGSPLPKALAALAPDEALVLAHDQHNVTFEFAAPDFAAPQRVRYAYRLEGLDAEWQDAGARHAAAYTTLPPGRYTFRVRAVLDGSPGPAADGPAADDKSSGGTSPDGASRAAWGGREASLRVVVRPPWWGTWAFRLAAAALATLAAWRLLRFRERRRLEVALGRQALRDALTGLANRALFHDRVAHALARRARAPGGPGAGGGVAVLYLDLDGFKAVNDASGHAAGDRLLVAVAARLLNATRGCDTVARLGGDEFAVLVENVARPADAEAVAARIVAALAAPIPLGDAPAARVGVSVGLALAGPAEDGDTLLRHADAAMYRAKADGKGRYALFDPALAAAASARQALQHDLARAVGAAAGGARDEFALVYQPIVDLASGEVVAAEALVRWHHPARGLVGPAEFIPLAEASGLVGDLGRWVLAEACRAAAAWPAGPGGRAARVAVNVSARQFADPALAADVMRALTASGLAPERLTLEMTESALMRDTDAALAGLGALRALGVRLAVDDFGTGYSSLAYLQRFPVDVLKIDKRFVDALDDRGGAIARTVVALGGALGLRTVAEGVETAEQAAALRAMGCGLAQGYLFARPMDDAALRALLAEASAAGAAGAAARG